MNDNWKKKFDEDSLERGRAAFLKGRVVDLKEDGGNFSAAVLGRERFEVSLKKLASGASRVSCRCPVAKAGRYCEHMAALMFAIEARKKAEQDSRAEKDLMEQWRKMDEELRQEKERKLTEEEQKKREKRAARERRRKESSMTQEEKEKLLKQQEEERRRQQEEERRRQEEEARRMQAEKEERERRRRAREERKAEMARKKEEQKRLAEEAARIEYEKRQAEEARREAIRQQKAEEARRKAEKREREREMQRQAEEARRQEEIRRQKEEEKRKKAEEKRLRAEQKRKAEEMKRLLEEQRQREEEERRIQEERARAEAERRKDEETRQHEYTLLGNSWEDEEGEASAAPSAEIQDLENYRYFSGTAIRRSMTAPAKVLKEGEQLGRQGQVMIKQVISGFDGRNRERRGQMDAIGRKDGREFPLRMIFTRSDLVLYECGCPKCRADYYAQYTTDKTSCAYKIAGLILLENFLNTHNIGDSTDRSGQSLIAAFERRRANLVMAGTSAKAESLQLVPRLTRKNGELSLSFKVGANKLFVIKKLDVFCQNVKNSATDVYGTSTEINHASENFTDRGRSWIRLINRIVREESEFQMRLTESRFYYGRTKESVGSNLELFGWRLDEFFENMGEESIEFEDKDSYEKKKQTLTCCDRNPRVTMQISEDKIAGEKGFHGIKVEGTFPDLYYGTDTVYFISDGHLNRADKDFMEMAEPLANLSTDDQFQFHVGRNRMSEFYNRVLPGLKEIADVTETQPEKFRSYLLPEARFTFYLDIRDKDAVCRVFARYGEKEVSALDVLNQDGRAGLEPFRDISREDEIMYQTMIWFPEVDWEHRELSCGSREDLIYELMKNGTEKLMELGEVRCTKRFLGYHTVNHVKVSVGVSVSSGLLNLDISTEDVPAAELLDILKSYRRKEKYYRLKEGAFVDLEEPSLEMLSELMEAMHLKPGEFLKGRMKLPMYRTLYLDKLLEENENVYSSRDSRFRELVKSFKTVKDADFEEPKSLSRVMRKYQKDGYRWLRTLEAWQFGGILADDMGLGKTLQVIAVLLAAKEEGKEGTSLVVAPASLVFNWGEEFARFAPDIRVTLVTGNQEEREKKLADYRECDVLVTSYDLLKRDIAFYEDKEFSYEIIDEAQYIKNHTTAAAKAVKVIHSRTRYALTGTPIENRLSELWSIFDYLMPGFLYTYEVFKREIETPVVKNGDEQAMQRLQKMAGPFILRRLKGDVLKDLPEKLEEFRYVRLGSSQQKVYDGQVLHMKERLARQDKEDFNKNKLLILAELTRLRQICCDPSLCFEDYKGEAAKLEACLDLIQSAMDGGHRMLVFSQFTSMLEILQRELTSLGVSYYTITGSTSKEKRLELVKSFNEGTVPVFLISLKAGGVGLNLTGADVVIHYDPWWNLAAQNQATDRAHRIGQKNKVTVYKLIARHTIEEKIQKLQETKRDLAEQVIGGETGGLGGLSREELLELLEV